jgi:hypothetical protein
LLYLLQLLPGFGVVVVVFSVVGVIGLFRREEIFSCVFLSSVALLMFWPFYPGRYMASLAPILVLFLFRGMVVTEYWIKSKGGGVLSMGDSCEARLVSGFAAIAA